MRRKSDPTIETTRAIDEPAAPPAASSKIQITAPRMHTIVIPIEGTSPFVSNRFGLVAKSKMQLAQGQGSTTRGKRQRDPKDFDEGYKDSMYVSKQGWYGINASSFRQAAISACRIVGFKMTFAKLAIFIEADGVSDDGQTELVRIEGEPRQFIAAVRNSTGVADLRSRGMFEKWSAKVRVRFDADMFTSQDILNLFSRIGLQVGIGAGRPDSRESAGQGWGLFAIGSNVQIIDGTKKAA